jgi:hypothetical protein
VVRLDDGNAGAEQTHHTGSFEWQFCLHQEAVVGLQYEQIILRLAGFVDTNICGMREYEIHAEQPDVPDDSLFVGDIVRRIVEMM